MRNSNKLANPEAVQGKRMGLPKWGDFWSLLSKHRPALWIIIVAVVLGLGETLLSLLIPLFTMDMVNQLSAASLQGTTIVSMISVFLFQALMSGCSIYTMSYVGQYVVARLRSEVWQRVLKLPVSFFDRNTSGEVMSRITNDTNVIKDFITAHVISFFSGLLSIIGAVILLLMIDWKITLFMLLAVPVALLILWPIGARMFGVSKKMQDETALFQGDLGRVLSEIRLVKASLAEPLERERGDKRITHLFRYGLKEARITAILSPLMMSIMMLLLVMLIGYGGVRVAEGSLTGGELVAIILYMFQVVVPFTQLASFFTQFQKAMGASERIIEILREELEESHPQVIEQPLREQASDRQKSLRFDTVSFGYAPDKFILRDLSMTIEAGQMTAFVGPSGAGKTTLFSLIERFYEPSAGTIFYGSMPLSSLRIQDWRSRIAYVSQESPMMGGTIRDNLTYGLEEVDEEKMKEAVEQANLSAFISSLEKGYDTEVGERGVKLSGGQRQRLAIARAILRDPEILLLDEATAHLDSASEQLVQEALRVLMQGRTTLVIAHRLSTVRNADKIFVLEKGVITGHGTHDELLVTHEFYRKLVQQQFDQTG
ncbi:MULTISPECIES: ABC transporter ATP-binding protein [Aneurinibacillus]|uniref:ABC transporter ATP-binding protein n=1 Tax=Aneurinibacillus TaxID=55079 RepID=UPI0009E9D38A|nr:MULTISPECIES: ABC transporter ATP-binding protein [Aneurinibacillus]MED0738443.1 ABC transporter ATP-binding protein [Aneurinibacillus thermoaerophilus]MED0756085.1 ABC transporter ATP-binding protein [Aneurinibacillus thermoaerophilus]MED0762315.1 ABC transporter ATP-binding protein [Aneurinibacillus thermoaerophilus]